MMGSESDLKTMTRCLEALDVLGIPHDARILSAHRTPAEVRRYVEQSSRQGVDVFIAAAGMAAHLAGAVAAHTTKPVIGVPMNSGNLDGLDALLATVQMPKGVPVATVAIGAAGAANAAILAAQILAVSDKALARKLDGMRKANADKVKQADKKLRKERNRAR